MEPVRVVSATGIWTSVATWLSAIGIGGVLIAVIRQAVPWRKAVSDERAADFDRLREDVREARKDAKEAKDTAQRLENMIACLRPAVSILTAEVRRLDPQSENNAALRQVQELMAMAAAGDFGFNHAMVGLSQVKGTNE